MINQPTRVTNLVKTLGIKKLGKFYLKEKKYTIVVVPDVDSVGNFFERCVHGGYITGIFADAFAMLAYFTYGINTGTTDGIYVKFNNLLKMPGKEKELPPGEEIVFEVMITEEKKGFLEMEGMVKKGKFIIATSQSLWKLRKNR